MLFLSRGEEEGIRVPVEWTDWDAAPQSEGEAWKPAFLEAIALLEVVEIVERLKQRSPAPAKGKPTRRKKASRED